MDRQTDMTKLIVAFFNFPNAPKNEPRPDRNTIYFSRNIHGQNGNRLLKLLAGEGVRLNSEVVTLYCMTDWFAHSYGIVDDTVILNVVSRYVEIFAVATH